MILRKLNKMVNFIVLQLLKSLVIRQPFFNHFQQFFFRWSYNSAQAVPGVH